ncbi:MAG: DUF892 family protein [Armatimonadota bacterium]
MAINNQKDLFVKILSNVRQGTENATTIYQMMSEEADNPDIKDALQARAFVSNNVLNTIDKCFDMIGENPVKPTGRLHDVFVEDFRKELSEIDSPSARRLYILIKASHLNQLRIGEFVALTEAADVTGNYGVGLLLETCLADKMAFVDRTRHLIRNIVESKIESKRM